MRNPPTFSTHDPDSTQISKLTQIHHICYTLTPTIDYISEPYSNSRTSTQHVSKWHRLHIRYELGGFILKSTRARDTGAHPQGGVGEGVWWVTDAHPRLREREKVAAAAG